MSIARNFAELHEPRRKLTHKISARVDQVLLAILLLYASNAWYYPADVETQVDVDAPFRFPFQIAAQCIGFYALIRLGPLGAFRAFSKQKLFLALLAWGGLSTFWSSDPFNTFGMFRAMLLTMFCGMYFGRRLSPATLIDVISKVLCLIMIGSAIAAMFFSFGAGAGHHLGSWRGLFGHKNELGEVSSVAILFFGARILSAQRITIGLVLPLVPAVACCIFSGSANAVAASAVGLCLSALAAACARLSRQRSINRALFAFGAVSIVGLLYLSLVAVLMFIGRDLSFTGRTIIWNVYLTFADQRPFAGWGWTTSSSNETIITTIRDITKLAFIRSPHSAYVGILVDLGYVGLSLYVAWLASTLIRSTMAAAGKRDQLNTLRTAITAGMVAFGAFEVSAGFLPSLWSVLIVLLTAAQPRVSLGGRIY